MIIVIVLILLLFLTGMAFFKISKKYQKSKLIYTVLGLFSFIVGCFVYILFYIIMIDLLSEINRYTHEFLCFFIGGLFSFLTYSVIERMWRK